MISAGWGVSRSTQSKVPSSFPVLTQVPARSGRCGRVGEKRFRVGRAEKKKMDNGMLQMGNAHKPTKPV